MLTSFHHLLVLCVYGNGSHDFLLHCVFRDWGEAGKTLISQMLLLVLVEDRSGFWLSSRPQEPLLISVVFQRVVFQLHYLVSSALLAPLLRGLGLLKDTVTSKVSSWATYPCFHLLCISFLCQSLVMMSLLIHTSSCHRCLIFFFSRWTTLEL